MALIQNLQTYRASIKESQGFITHAHQTYASGAYKITGNLRKFISESAFLKVFIAWETFVESCFIDFLLNEPSIQNNRPAKWANPIDREHAHQLLRGTQKYVDWANPEIVKRLSKIFFHQGYVFNQHLGAINSDLLDLKTIRNSAAHLSSSTSTQLDGLSSRLLNQNCQNYTAYKLLFSNKPNTAPMKAVIEYYIELLDVTAENIANG